MIAEGVPAEGLAGDGAAGMHHRITAADIRPWQTQGSRTDTPFTLRNAGQVILQCRVVGSRSTAAMATDNTDPFRSAGVQTQLLVDFGQTICDLLDLLSQPRLVKVEDWILGKQF